MERHNSPLTDKEIVRKAYWWIEQLIKSGGKDFVMHVPARLDHDTDLVFFNLAKRFEGLLDNIAALKAKCERYFDILKKAHSLQSLWLFNGVVEAEHEGEAQALSNLSDEINGVIYEALSAGEGEKEE